MYCGTINARRSIASCNSSMVNAEATKNQHKRRIGTYRPEPPELRRLPRRCVARKRHAPVDSPGSAGTAWGGHRGACAERRLIRDLPGGDCGVAAARQSAPIMLRQVALADAYALGRHFDQFIVGNKFNRILKCQFDWRREQ